eukprot:430399-Amphidinium_carterae.1
MNLVQQFFEQFLLILEFAFCGNIPLCSIPGCFGEVSKAQSSAPPSNATVPIRHILVNELSGETSCVALIHSIAIPTMPSWLQQGTYGANPRNGVCLCCIHAIVLMPVHSSIRSQAVASWRSPKQAYVTFPLPQRSAEELSRCGTNSLAWIKIWCQKPALL